MQYKSLSWEQFGFRRIFIFLNIFCIHVQPRWRINYHCSESGGALVAHSTYVIRGGGHPVVARFVRPCKIVCEDFHRCEMIVAHSWTYKSRPPCFLHAPEQTQCWQWKRAIAAQSTVLGTFRNMTTYNMQNSVFYEIWWWIHHSSEPGRLMFFNISFHHLNSHSDHH